MTERGARLDRLCELTVIRQVGKVASDVFVLDAWAAVKSSPCTAGFTRLATESFGIKPTGRIVMMARRMPPASHNTRSVAGSIRCMWLRLA
jgi:hypothetical protein